MLGDPVVETPCRGFHDRGKFAAIIIRGEPAFEHALNHPDIFLENNFPERGVTGPQLGKILVGSLGTGVVQFNMLIEPVMATRLNNDAERMVAMHPQQQVRENGNVFGGLVPVA